MAAEQTVPREPPRTSGAPQLGVLRRGSSATRSYLGVSVGWLERHALFVTGLAAVAGVILGKVPSHLNQDGWLALVDGRYVAQHGIPDRDTLATLTHGVRWVDQQWLAQLTIYGLHQLGGLALYSIVYVCLTVGGIAMAIAAARRFGGTDSHVMWVLPLGAFLYFAGSFQIRTQGFAYPLFAATLWLLAAEVRSASRRRVYLVFPLLMLWGNLHGSASLGAGLVALCGVCLLVRTYRTPGSWPARRRGLALLVGGPLCLLVTPYGLSGLSYYRETLTSPVFKSLVTEWQPVTTVTILAVPFFLAALGTVWILGRAGSRARLFDALTLLMLIAGAISAIRNITWFALAAIILLPPMLGAVVPPKPAAQRRRRLNLALVCASGIYVLLSLGVVAGERSSWFERGYDERTLATVASVLSRHPEVRIYADARYADWLLWRAPALAGHIAYDSRLELLSANQMLGVARLGEIEMPGSRSILSGYGLLVLDSPSVVTDLLRAQRGTKTILRGHGVVVAARGEA